MNYFRNSFIAIVGILCLVSVSGRAQASIVWGNNASAGKVTIEAFDTTTGLRVDEFLVPNSIAVNDNGRGIAVLGHTIYYTTASSGNIYITNDSTHADLGILVNTGFAGIANIATDGQFLYANNYQSTSGVINKYDLSGNLVGTITVGPGIWGRDGFEVQNNPNINNGATTFISNNGDAEGPYDVYDSSGNKIIAGFIAPGKDGFSNRVTGIAYDGTNYFVSEIYNNMLLEYDGTGTFLKSIDLSANTPPFWGIRYLEDLSAVGNTIDNPPPSVPEPTTMLLMGFGLAGLAGLKRKFRN